MRRTAKELRDLIAALPDDAPVFAEVWTPEDVRAWLRQWMGSPEDADDAVQTPGSSRRPRRRDVVQVRQLESVVMVDLGSRSARSD